MKVLFRAFLILFLLSATHIAAEDTVKKNALTILIDKSGSMKNERRIHNVKESINLFIEEMTDEEYISIIAFDSSPFVFQLPELASNPIKERIKKRINTMLHPSDTTNLIAALDYAKSNLKKLVNTENRIVVITDGKILNDGKNELSAAVKAIDCSISILHISNEEDAQSFKGLLGKKDSLHIVPKEALGKQLSKELALLRTR